MTQLADHIAHACGPSGPNKVRACAPLSSLRKEEHFIVPVYSPFGGQRFLLTWPNIPKQEYLYNLAAAVRLLCPASEDAYLAQLERLVRERDPDLTSSSSSSSPLQSRSVMTTATATAGLGAGAGSPDRLGARM